MSDAQGIFRAGLFEGRVAVVSGGATGIGLAIAEQLVALGARVVLTSRKADRLVTAARGLAEEYGAEVEPIVCNIRKRDEVEALFDRTLERFGKLDYLVNNGGGQFPGAAADFSERGWQAVIDTNLNGTWHMTQVAAQKYLLAHGGKVVTIVADVERGFPGMAHTGAARAGVINLSKTLAVEWAQAGVLVNCIAPGIILSTGMHNYPPGVVEASLGRIPLKRLGTQVQVASAVSYLLSPAGDYVTGETLKVDGGSSLWGDMWPIADPAEQPAVTIPPWPEQRWPQHVPPTEPDD